MIDEIIDREQPKGTVVKLRDALDSIVPDPAAAHVYGQPYETPDGVTVVPVARVRGRTKRGADADLHLTARPVGVFVIKDGEATWVPAVDSTRIALMGELIGLVSATLASLAMVRRPPWPDLRGTVSYTKPR
ncbi:MAG TPA: hypothetical protein VHT50_20115 [Mycobacterium sp.]|jgi:hypothetical protein|nr:hypothetical protein [Mycobacterium sp.]